MDLIFDADRCAELEAENEKLRAGLEKVNDVINAIIMADQSVQHSNGQKGLLIKHGQIRSIFEALAGVDHG
jgi:hypothetical protein